MVVQPSELCFAEPSESDSAICRSPVVTRPGSAADELVWPASCEIMVALLHQRQVQLTRFG